MKTNAEWYRLLPEPLRMQAMNNAEREDMLDKHATSLAAALFAFPWETSRQGYRYWKSVYDRVVSGELPQVKNE